MYRAVNTFEWCVLHIFLSGISQKKKMPLNFCIFKLLLYCCCLNLIETISQSGAWYYGGHLSALRCHPYTHTSTRSPLTPNHSRMAFTTAPCRALPLVERAVWQHLNWRYVPLTRSTVTCRSSWKRLTWPQNPRVMTTRRRVLTRHILIGFYSIGAIILVY